MTCARFPSGTSRRPGGAARAPARYLARLLARLRGDSTGSMALEYALVAPAFIALMLGVLHVALIYFAQEGLETAVEQGARMIVTGQAQTLVLPNGKTTYTGMTASDFKTAICSGISGQVASTDSTGKTTFTPITYPKSLPPFLTCNRLAVNVQVVPTGCTTPTITTPNYTYNSTTGALTSTGSGYGSVTCSGTGNTNNGIAGTQGDLVILQLTYLWPTASLPMGFNLVNQQNGNRLLLATYVFTVENYICADGTTTSC
jgi:Flp pilus assembly protein TadG